MRPHTLLAAGVVLILGCSGEDPRGSGPVPSDLGGRAGASSAGGSGSGAGSASVPAAGQPGNAGSGGATGSSAQAGAESMSAGSGGVPSSSGGGAPSVAGSSSGAGGLGGSAGAASASAGASGQAGSAGAPAPDSLLDCGSSGVALEAHGPARNRVNYVIVGDGYTRDELDTVYMDHVARMLEPRFTEAFQPYRRYRKFVNICVLKVESATSGVGTTAGNTAFESYGNDETRLGYVNDRKVSDAIRARLPADIEVDWTAIVLNGDRWWNAGGRYMVWSGAHEDAALAAQHEGGHSFQALADEYGGTSSAPRTEPREINVTIDATGTANKWKEWLGFEQTPGTGAQGAFEGGRYADRGVWRPSKESVMNSLWASAYFNSVSLEQAVRVFYDKVRPIDSATPASTTAPSVLRVDVIDPAVISVDWSVDGQLVAAKGGATFDVAARALPSGAHRITARAYDETPWVRGDRAELEQSIEWTIQVP